MIIVFGVVVDMIIVVFCVPFLFSFFSINGVVISSSLILFSDGTSLIGVVVISISVDSPNNFS